MNDIQVFNNSEFGEVRTVLIGDDVWFIAKDICDILGLSDVSRSVEKLEDDEKLIRKIFVSGQNRDILIINESGLYTLIIRSNKPEARQFRKWVTAEVLPSIRKHGLYAVDELLNNPDMAIKAFQALKEERAARIEAERKNAVLMHVSKTYTATEIAKELGLKSANELNKELEKRGIQFKVNNTWVPKADYADKGFFDIKQEVLDTGTVIYHRRITQDGRTFILELFNKAA
ncbi:phage antirepressor [Treponema putidum]|uniref:phage antirepressor n=1 Tax=Treponema putidum TaxID=221027 RepID=UPI003D8B9339